MTNHPITPPPEHLKLWEDQHFDEGENYDVMLIQAYQAGADAELEACSQWIHGWYGNGSREVVGNLYAARRPKPPSLKEQALAESEPEGPTLDEIDDLCAEHSFCYEDSKSLECLLLIITDALARWGK